ncbi:helix-turn-helix domain-containing protein [Streptomyces acidicola]|uniref:DUF2690 domain-containing protein n=1 Tax=Streptomyces acidicola TaxID=2596892 RepID=A0A5N8WXZ9_9ACTN|nr:XRE family transcriptional regulator [Streptomyces acidicola]MPY52207.1 DUF2690 domain-containing protein [Streptomyces acidicola]
MTRTPPPTPPTPSPERARLATALRELKARTGLSLAALAGKTAFSKSSWERYLNGKTLPPRTAVQELCRLAGEPDGRCLALWEIAESQWSGRATGATRTDTPSQPSTSLPLDHGEPARQEVTRAGHRGVAVMAVLASVCAVAAGGVAVALFLLPRQDGEPRPYAPVSPSAPGPLCRGAACEGKSPMQMRCGAGPKTLAAHHTATRADLELRYSSKCGTSWARMWNTRIGDRLELTAGGRNHGVRRAEIEDDADAQTYVYTPMTAIRPGTVVRACFRPAEGSTECFDGRVR